MLAHYVEPSICDHEAALAELVKAKMEGRSLPKPKKVEVSKPNDLLAALR